MSQKKELTTGERLFIERKRLGMSQANMAACHGVPHGVYGRWERDQKANRPAPVVKVGRLKKHEQCMLERVRIGWSQAEVAKKLGLCVYWVGRMERGEINCDRLAALLGVE